MATLINNGMNMANINFNTNNQTYRQAIGNDLTYQIPTFQRDYSWQQEEWEDLWNDIINIINVEQASHYMGYLVLQTDNQKDFIVIDGQQRITTITIIILAALKNLQDLIDQEIDPQNNKTRLNTLRQTFIGYLDPVSLVPQSKLKLNNHNDNFFQTYLIPLKRIPQRGLKASEHLLRKAFEYYTKQIQQHTEGQDGAKIAQFINQIVDKLFFTTITVTDELNAFTVFETLNARGVRLSSTDLLKNYLFSIIAQEGTHQTETTALEKRWERITDTLGSEKFPEFLRAYWNSKNSTVRKNELFKTLRKNITNKGQVFELINELDQASEIYAALRNANDDLWTQDERKVINTLQTFNVRQPLPLLLRVYLTLGQTTFNEILKTIVIISYRYNVICNKATNEQERIYNKISRAVNNGTHTNATEITNALKTELYPDDAEFEPAFTNKQIKTTNSRNKKVVRYTLLKIEQHISNIAHDPENDSITIEHILPENIETQTWGEFNEENIDNHIYRLGNMTLLEKNLNQEIGNQPYEIKKQAYEQSQYTTTKTIAQRYDTWSEDKINVRQQHMANAAKQIWRLN